MTCAFGAVPPGSVASCSMSRTAARSAGQDADPGDRRAGRCRAAASASPGSARRRARTPCTRAPAGTATPTGRSRSRSSPARSGASLVRAQPPGDRTGKAELRLLAEADRAVEPHISRGVKSHRHLDGADVARLRDHLGDRQRCRADARRVIVEPVIVMRAGRGLDHGAGVTRPLSSAQAAMNGFIVEPGSKVSVSARLRSCAPLRLRRSAGE